jgi:hypothetical protein
MFLQIRRILHIIKKNEFSKTLLSFKSFLFLRASSIFQKFSDLFLFKLTNKILRRLSGMNFFLILWIIICKPNNFFKKWKIYSLKKHDIWETDIHIDFHCLLCPSSHPNNFFFVVKKKKMYVINFFFTTPKFLVV